MWRPAWWSWRTSTWGQPQIFTCLTLRWQTWAHCSLLCPVSSILCGGSIHGLLERSAGLRGCLMSVCLQVACDVKMVVNESLIYASILTIVAFTIERLLSILPQSFPFPFPRYQAICHPLTLNSRTGVGRARRVILLVWFISTVSAFPWSIFAKVNYIKYNGEELVQSAWCSMPFNEEDLDTTPLYFTVASTFLYFVVPFTIVFVLYLRWELVDSKAGEKHCVYSAGLGWQWRQTKCIDVHPPLMRLSVRRKGKQNMKAYTTSINVQLQAYLTTINRFNQNVTMGTV